jgi:phosphomannomutase
MAEKSSINKSIFKSYDVRGIYPSEINEDQAYLIGRAFIRQTGAKKVAVGQDARLGSPTLFKALARGILAEGGQISDIGQVPTECLYFSVGSYDYDGGVMVTASHNPKEYDGFKMVQRQQNNIKVLSGKNLLATVEAGNFEKENEETRIKEEKRDVWPDYIKHVLQFVDLAEIMPLKVVIDASNGVGGIGIEKLKDKLPIEIIPLNFNPDGNFPNHSPNPVIEGSADQISKSIKEQKADFGFIFDGDADRIFLVDENGKLIPSDVTILLLAKHFLKKNPGMGIARHVTCSKAIPEFVEKWGGKPIRTKVGFIFIQEGLVQNNGIMGGELSGHYCFKDNFYSDSGLIAFLTLLQVISQDGRKVSEMAKELFPYAKGPEINFEVKNKEEIMEKIKQKYADGKQDFLDGVTVEYKDYWFNVRPSNTEPLLRLTIEADTQDLLKQKQKELTKVISGK